MDLLTPLRFLLLKSSDPAKFTKGWYQLMLPMDVNILSCFFFFFFEDRRPPVNVILQK